MLASTGALTFLTELSCLGAPAGAPLLQARIRADCSLCVLEYVLVPYDALHTPIRYKHTCLAGAFKEQPTRSPVVNVQWRVERREGRCRHPPLRPLPDGWPGSHKEQQLRLPHGAAPGVPGGGPHGGWVEARGV